MENTIKRTVAIVVKVEHLKNSSVFGEITDEMLREHFQAWVEVIFIKTPIYEEHGDFFTVSEPGIIMTQAQLDTLFIVAEEDTLPTDDAT